MVKKRDVGPHIYPVTVLSRNVVHVCTLYPPPLFTRLLQLDFKVSRKLNSYKPVEFCIAQYALYRNGTDWHDNSVKFNLCLAYSGRELLKCSPKVNARAYSTPFCSLWATRPYLLALPHVQSLLFVPEYCPTSGFNSIDKFSAIHVCGRKKSAKSSRAIGC